jgi:two-component system, NtrC family, nitrogen regulation response regulator GlnG
MGSTILVADDDRAIRTVLNQALARLGHEVRMTGSATTLWRWGADGEGDLVITDVIMPDENGLDLIPRIKKLRPELRVIVMSAQNTLLTAVKATERGAFEYLPKPFDLRELISVVERALSAPTLQVEELEAEDEQLPLIGRSPAMQEIYRSIARLMGTDLSVLITGESGTGKELVARALHDFGKRRNGPFVAINMAAIPRELIESELFGHERGAFTGALQRRLGRFEMADQGTLFLDELAELPLDGQVKLLRVLQEREFERVGSSHSIRVDVRLIAATNRDLEAQVAAGRFREDLFYRVSVLPIRVPALRERAEDIPLFAQYFVNEFHRILGTTPRTIAPDASQLLLDYRWPGNVRELKNVIERACVLTRRDTIQASDLRLTPNQRAIPAPDEPLTTLDEHERSYLRRVLASTNGRIEGPRGAAAILGINPSTLRSRLRRLGIGRIEPAPDPVAAD